MLIGVAVEVRAAAETSPDQCEAECNRVENSRTMQCSSEEGTTKVMESPSFTGWPTPPQRIKNPTLHSGLDIEESIVKMSILSKNTRHFIR